MTESLLWSPHKPAKLYKRFTFSKDIKVGDDKIAVELNNYANFHSFNWVFETEVQKGETQPLPSLIIGVEYVTIKTNTHEDISQGDIIWLQCDMWQDGKFFIVSDTVKQDYIYRPNMTKTYKHVSLRSLV